MLLTARLRSLRTSPHPPPVPLFYQIRHRPSQALLRQPTPRQVSSQSSSCLCIPPPVPRLRQLPRLLPHHHLRPCHLPRRHRPLLLLVTPTKALVQQADLRHNPIFKHTSPDTTIYALNIVQPHSRTPKTWLQRPNNGRTIAYSSTAADHLVPWGKTSLPGLVMDTVYPRLSSLGLMKPVRLMFVFYAINLTYLNSAI
jgi:hypothetical protein